MRMRIRTRTVDLIRRRRATWGINPQTKVVPNKKETRQQLNLEARKEVNEDETLPKG